MKASLGRACCLLLPVMENIPQLTAQLSCLQGEQVVCHSLVLKVPPTPGPLWWDGISLLHRPGER